MEKSTPLHSTLLSKFNALPDEFKKQVLDFVDTLFKKSETKKKKGKRPFGTAKGKIIIKAGFDDPLEDFKDYM